MPSPKAVLVDIHELGLDPSVAHTSLSKKGRIRADEQVDVVVENKTELRSALVELQVSEEVPQVQASEPQPVSDVEKHSEESSSKKKNKKSVVSE